MVLEQTLLYCVAAVCVFLVVKWGIIPAFKYIFAPQLREYAAKRRMRIAEADLEAERLEAETLRIQTHQQQIAMDSIESLLHSSEEDNHSEHKHVH